MASPGERALHMFTVLIWLLWAAVVLWAVAGTVREHRKEHRNGARCGFAALVPCPQRRQLQSGLRLHGCDFASRPEPRA